MRREDTNIMEALTALVWTTQSLIEGCKIGNGMIETPLHNATASGPKMSIACCSEERGAPLAASHEGIQRIQARYRKGMERIARHCTIHIGDEAFPMKYGSITTEIKGEAIRDVTFTFRVKPNEFTQLEKVMAGLYLPGTGGRRGREHT